VIPVTIAKCLIVGDEHVHLLEEIAGEDDVLGAISEGGAGTEHGEKNYQCRQLANLLDHWFPTPIVDSSRNTVDKYLNTSIIPEKRY
jgi:hypothetical protein